MKFVKSTDVEWVQAKGYKKKIFLDENDLNCKGALVQLIVMEPHTSVGAHIHKKMTETFYILEGKGIFFVNEKEFQMKPGDSVVCEPNESHGARNESDKEFKFIVIKTNTEKGDMFWVEK